MNLLCAGLPPCGTSLAKQAAQVLRAEQFYTEGRVRLARLRSSALLDEDASGAWPERVFSLQWKPSQARAVSVTPTASPSTLSGIQRRFFHKEDTK